MFNKNVTFVLGAVFAFGLVQDGCCMKDKQGSNQPGRTVSFANPIETNNNENSNQTVPNLHKRQESLGDQANLEVNESNNVNKNQACPVSVRPKRFASRKLRLNAPSNQTSSSTLDEESK